MTSRRLAGLCLGALGFVVSVVPGAAQTWVQKGPAPGLNGQPENIANSPIAGAIEAVVAHPTDADIVWIGAVNGGIFKTTNATAASPTWTALTDDQTSLSIGALVLDPTDGTHNTLVAGTGLTSSYTRDGGERAGLLRTTNGGTSWSQITSLGGANVVGLAVRGNTMIAAVNQHDVAFSCTRVGIYRSTDGGTTFPLISNDIVGSGLPCGVAHDLASDPTDNTRLFAPMTTTGASSDGLYRSTDSGATWTEVSDNLAALDALMCGDLGSGCGQSLPSNVEVVVGNAGGANANVFVATCHSGRLSGLFHSADAGDSWASLDLPSTTEAGANSYGIHPGGQCSIHLSLIPDPTDHDVVYIGGDRQPANNEGAPGVQFPNSIGASNYGGRLFRVDGGATAGSQATPITNCGSALSGCGGSARTANDTAPHADSREMVFDANGDLIQTDDGGIYKHTNPSGTNGDWFSLIGDLAVVEQHDLDYDAVSDILISGNQDNGTTQQQTSASDDWTTILGGDGGDVVVAEGDPSGQSTRYFSAQNFAAGRRQVYNSSNVLQSTAFPSLTPLGGSPGPTAQFVLPLKVNRVTPTRLLFGAGNGVYESTDRLDSVTRITTAVANSFFGGGTMDYGAAGNADAVYIASDDDVYVRTGAIGTSLTQTDPDGSSSTDILGVVIDPDDGSTAYAVDINQVFRTTNGGTGWTDITGNLFTSFSPGGIRSIEYVNSGGDRLVVGTERGVFVAQEGALSTWASLGTGLPNAPVFELEFDAGDEVLVAGTLGRGAWLLDLAVGGGCAPDDLFEPDNSSGQASSITSGVTQAHKICPATDTDWATFTLAAESEVVIETSGASGDTRMWLRDAGLTQVEFDDDDGTGLFSQIDRTCAVDPLPAGTYFIEVDEFGNDAEIAAYDLDYTLVQACPGPCPDNVTLDNTTINTPQTQKANLTITVGPNTTINAAGGVTLQAGTSVSFGNGTSIGGELHVVLSTPTCP